MEAAQTGFTLMWDIKVNFKFQLHTHTCESCQKSLQFEGYLRGVNKGDMPLD